MKRPTGKTYAPINIDIWGDDDYLDLSPLAQHLYFVLWTDPQLSYCGAGTWDPAKIAAKSAGWTVDGVETAGAELSAAQFLIVDTAVAEHLLRSWIKHDGIWRKPNMAVSMASARAALASRTLRGVIVHEVTKLRDRNPELSSWTRDTVATMLTQKAIDPAGLTPFTPTTKLLTPSPTPTATPAITPGVTPALTVNRGVGVNPTADPAPTPTPSPTPTSKGGYVSTEGHQGPVPDPGVRPHCLKHPDGDTGAACRRCRVRREWDEQNTAAVEADEIAQRRAARAAADARRAACEHCRGGGWVLGFDGTPVDPAVRCTHQLQDNVR